jgi:hypothetical protein
MDKIGDCPRSSLNLPKRSNHTHHNTRIFDYIILDTLDTLRPPYRLLDLHHLFDPNRRNLNPMVPAPTTMTIDNTFDFKAYDY